MLLGYLRRAKINNCTTKTKAEIKANGRTNTLIRIGKNEI